MVDKGKTPNSLKPRKPPYRMNVRVRAINRCQRVLDELPTAADRSAVVSSLLASAEADRLNEPQRQIPLAPDPRKLFP